MQDDEITFQDSIPFDAEAVRINLERLLAPLLGIDVPDRRTVVPRLAHPHAPLLANLSGRAGMMISPAAIREHRNALLLFIRPRLDIVIRCDDNMSCELAAV